MTAAIALMILAQAAAGQPAAAQSEVPSTPAAAVSGRTVVHAGQKVRVHVPASAAYVGSERFNLYGVADAEVHVFVEADSARKMRRLYWVQFESYLPSNDHRYNYAEGNRRELLWGTPTWVRSGPASVSAPVREGSDRAHVMSVLKRGGYTVPSEVMNVRMVQILDDPQGTGRGRKELMVIYSEDLASTGATMADLAKAGPDGAQWKEIERGLVKRATEAVRIDRR